MAAFARIASYESTQGRSPSLRVRYVPQPKYTWVENCGKCPAGGGKSEEAVQAPSAALHKPIKAPG